MQAGWQAGRRRQRVAGQLAEPCRARGVPPPAAVGIERAAGTGSARVAAGGAGRQAASLPSQRRPHVLPLQQALTTSLE